jgi:beta-lysine 5,6-aminomutase beta subunit
MLVKPYGDTLNDGAVQLSFTLPIKDSAMAREAARQFVLKLGFEKCQIVDNTTIGPDFTMFVAYANTNVAIDTDTVHVDDSHMQESMDYYQINDFIRESIGRELIVVGACTGTDAHTIGIDAVMNMKGYNQHYGLERYKMIETHNLGAQVTNEKLIEYAVKVKADVILVSQIVTQKDVHIKNLTELVELLEADGIRQDFVLIAGGPRLSNKLAVELGYDAAFGRGTYAEHVASFFAKRIAEKNAQKS